MLKERKEKFDQAVKEYKSKKLKKSSLNANLPEYHYNNLKNELPSAKSVPWLKK